MCLYALERGGRPKGTDEEEIQARAGAVIKARTYRAMRALAGGK